MLKNSETKPNNNSKKINLKTSTDFNKYKRNYKNSFLENRIQSSFETTMNSKYISSPHYSFGKAKKYFLPIENLPGPADYLPQNYYAIRNYYFYNTSKFPKEIRFYRSKEYLTPGPGQYDIKRNIELNKKGIKFGKEKRFKDDDNIDNNLFLPSNY